MRQPLFLYKKVDKDGTVTLISDQSDEFVVADENGNVMAKIDVDGIDAVNIREINTSIDELKTDVSEKVDKESDILIITEKGYGKRTNIDEYRLTHRGSKGVKALNVTEKNGNLVSVKNVNDDDDLMIITDSGIIIKIPMNQVSKMSRVTQGVRLIHLKDDQKVTTIATSVKEEEEIEVIEE